MSPLQQVFVANKYSPPDSCSVSIPGGKDDVTSLLIQQVVSLLMCHVQPTFQALPCTVYTVDPDTVVYDSDLFVFSLFISIVFRLKELRHI